jgi:Sigma-70, region 4
VKTVDTAPDPEQIASRAELNQLLEQALLGLPFQYRAVVMLRDVEDLSTSETASALDLTEENVKIRLHRGRAMMRAWLFERVGQTQRIHLDLWAPAATVLFTASSCGFQSWAAMGRGYADASRAQCPKSTREFRSAITAICRTGRVIFNEALPQPPLIARMTKAPISHHTQNPTRDRLRFASLPSTECVCSPRFIRAHTPILRTPGPRYRTWKL